MSVEIEFDVLIERIATMSFDRSSHLFNESCLARDRGNFELSENLRSQCAELDNFRNEIRKMKNQFMNLSEKDLIMEMYHIAIVLQQRFNKSVYKDMAVTLYDISGRASNLIPTRSLIELSELH